MFSDELTALLQRLADNISFALENFEREERFRTVVDSANEGILVYDRGHRIVAANAAAERIIRAAPGELIGKPGFTSMFPCVREDGSPLAPGERPTLVTARTGQPLTDRILGIVRPDGAVTWISVNTAFLRRPGNRGAPAGERRTLRDGRARDERRGMGLEPDHATSCGGTRISAPCSATRRRELERLYRLVDLAHPPGRRGVREARHPRRDRRAAESWSAEYRFAPQGRLVRRGAATAGCVIRDADGRPARMIGAMVDVTERKEAERRVQLHAQRNEGIARLGQFALDATDLDAVFAEAVRMLKRLGLRRGRRGAAVETGDEFLDARGDGRGRRSQRRARARAVNPKASGAPRSSAA